MADTSHHTTHIPKTEGDGIHYRGLAWSMIILAAITLLCYAIVVGVFKFIESRQAAADTPRTPLAAAPVTPSIEHGRVRSGNSSATPLLVNEPMNLDQFKKHEQDVLTSYGWVDQGAGTVRVPIDVAKDLLLKQGLAVRGGAAAAQPHDTHTPAQPAPPAPPAKPAPPAHRGGQ